MLTDLWFRLRSLLFSRRVDAELDEELQFHLDHEQAKLEYAGLDPIEARRRALATFGGLAQTVESSREARGISLLTDFSKDLRYGWRSLRRNAVFSLAVAGSLVLGIGASVTVFTLMRATLWRPMPVAHPEETFHVRRADPARTDGRENSSSYVLFQQLHDAAGSSAALVAKTTASRRTFGTSRDASERATIEAVTDQFFSVFGIVPAAGRLLTTGDDSASGGRRVAVLSHRFWTTRFGADRQVVGQTVYVDDTPFEVVGVAARGFDGVDAERPVHIWLPVTADVQITPQWLTSSSYYWLTMLARVPRGTSVAALESTLDTRFRAHLEQTLLPSLSPRFRAMFGKDRIRLRPAAAGLATTGRRYESQLHVLAAIAGCIFLICCANIASLVRARSAHRHHEFALRRALGAGTGRLFRQLLVEGLLLGVIGVACSIVAAPWISSAILSLVPTMEPLAFNLTPDAWIVATAAALGVASVLIAITLPGWRRATVRMTVGHASRTTSRPALSRATLAMQLAIVLVLLVVAGLSVSVLQRLRAVGLGFDPTAVTAVDLSFPKSTPAARVSTTFEAVRQQLDDASAVESATYAFPAIYDVGGMSMAVAPANYVAAPGEDISVGMISVGPRFFETLRIPIVEGRGFTPADLSAASVVVVNERFARRYFAGRTAIGEAVRIPAMPAPRISQIVGVVADVRHYGVRSEPWPMVYQPGSSGGARLLVRGRETSASLAAIRNAVASAGAPAQVESVRPLADAVAVMIGRERLLAALSSSVALIAIALAAVGLYGIVAYGVTCRRLEFGVRLALGARPADVRRLVLGESLPVVAVGLAAGTAGALAAARILQRLVPDSPALDWRLLLAAALGLTAVTLVASWIPASRASHTDPAQSLRST